MTRTATRHPDRERNFRSDSDPAPSPDLPAAIARTRSPKNESSPVATPEHRRIPETAPPARRTLKPGKPLPAHLLRMPPLSELPFQGVKNTRTRPGAFASEQTSRQEFFRKDRGRGIGHKATDPFSGGVSQQGSPARTICERSRGDRLAQIFRLHSLSLGNPFPFCTQSLFLRTTRHRTAG